MFPMIMPIPIFIDGDISFSDMTDSMGFYILSMVSIFLLELVNYSEYIGLPFFLEIIFLILFILVVFKVFFTYIGLIKSMIKLRNVRFIMAFAISFGIMYYTYSFFEWLIKSLKTSDYIFDINPLVIVIGGMMLFLIPMFSDFIFDFNKMNTDNWDEEDDSNETDDDAILEGIE